MQLEAATSLVSLPFPEFPDLGGLLASAAVVLLLSTAAPLLIPAVPLPTIVVPLPTPAVPLPTIAVLLPTAAVPLPTAAHPPAVERPGFLKSLAMYPLLLS